MSAEYYDSNGSTFEQSYRCYPAAFIEKPHLEKGDKVIMPPSALHRLASLQIDYPMLFEITNPSAGRVSHCGVLEFIADEGVIYLPYWMMENMQLQEGDIVQVKNSSLTKGTYVKLQPHSKDFLNISNPKAVLEKTLRNFSCLTTGNTIMFVYNNKKFYIDIVESKPSNAISIIETDCEVDFAPPLDYVEPEKPVQSTAFKRSQPEDPEDPPNKIGKHDFSPFTGSARRLDGKTSTHSEAPVSWPLLKQHQSKVAPLSNDSKSSNSSSRRHHGKLVFGSNGDQTPTATPKVTPKDGSSQKSPDRAEKPTFQAFSGKKYSLKG